MDFTEYRQRGKEMVDYIADYLENIRDRKVFPDVKPGYMRNLLPDSAPIEGEDWDNIFADVERVIMPGITHWQSPHMHAYFPALNSFPSLLGDMLADAINCLGFTWASSPACTELEIIVMNWLGKMIGLPDEYLHMNNNSKGGGVIQTTASEATLVCLLAGRTRAIRKFHEQCPGYQDAEINARLVAYCSDQAHSSVEKAALIGLVRMRYIEADENLSMRGEPLREAIEHDIKQGLVPFWVCATLGTTGSCAFDILEEIGIVCREFKLWLHVDAAYAGSAFICPEYRTWLKGIERADSIAFNPSKWLMVHFDATALWVKDSSAVHRTFNVEPLYLQHENSGVSVDYMHWQIPLSRRFRALKIWFVLRSFGIKGLQKHIREGVRLAQKFEALVLADHRFEIPAKRYLGLVVFRLKGDNELTERLLKRLNHRGNLHCIPSSLKGKYVIRFTVTATGTTVEDIVKDWTEIRRVTCMVLEEMNIKISERTKVALKDTKIKNEAFGSSLLLSNSPMSPKIVNGSFAAIFDADEFLAKTYAGIRIAHQESPSMRRRVRGILMSGKQFSLDSHMDVVVQTCLDSSTTTTHSDSYGKTATDNSKAPNPIREDIEEGWEVYEFLMKTPLTPPASVSPLFLTPTPQNLNVTRVNAQLSNRSISEVAAFTDSVRAHNRRQPPQTLTIPSTTNKNMLATSSAFKTVNSFQPPRPPLWPSVTLTTQIHSASRTATHSQYHNHVSSTYYSAPPKQPPPIVQSPIAPLISSNFVVAAHGRRQRQDTLTSSEDDSVIVHSRAARSSSGGEVYHGKRYLDPVAHLFDDCSFTNSGFCSTNPFGSIPETKAVTNTSVDWMAVLYNFSSAPHRRRPNKIRLRISDEHGRRVRSSFDSNDTDNSCSTPMSPLISPQTPLLLTEYDGDKLLDASETLDIKNSTDSGAASSTSNFSKTPVSNEQTSLSKYEHTFFGTSSQPLSLNHPSNDPQDSSTDTGSSAISSQSSSLESF